MKQIKKEKKKVNELTKKIKKIESLKETWRKFDKKWYKEKDVLERFILIKEAIVDLKICHSTKCEIFQPIASLEILIEGLEFTNLKDAKEELGEFNPKFKVFRGEQYAPINDDLTTLKQLVLKLHSTTTTRRYEQKQAEKRRNKLIELCGKFKVPYQTTVGEDADQISRDDEEQLMPYDEELTEETGIFTPKKRPIKQPPNQKPNANQNRPNVSS